MGPLGGMGGGAGGQPGGFRFEDVGDLGDLFGGLFNRGRGAAGGAGRPRRGTGPQRGADLQAELHLSFEDAVTGVTTAVHLTSEAACSRCGGNGAEPGTSPLVCTNCGGRGVLDDNQGFFSFSQPCPTCQGRGTIVETPCSNCRGSGVEHRPREVKVRVPAGVQDGQRIRLKGRGAPGRNGGRSEEHTSELQSLMRISYAVFCLKKKNKTQNRKKYSNMMTRMLATRIRAIKRITLHYQI